MVQLRKMAFVIGLGYAKNYVSRGQSLELIDAYKAIFWKLVGIANRNYFERFRAKIGIDTTHP